MTTLVFFKAALVVVLSSFTIVTAVSFLRVRLRKKEAQFASIIRVLGLSEDEVRLFSPTVGDEYAVRDYLLPVLFNTLVCVTGFTALIFGADLLSINPEKQELLLTAGRIDATGAAVTALRFRSMLVLTLAFIGAFIWSAREVIRRLITGDLTPSVYYSGGLRMIFAALLSLMLSFLVEAMPFSSYSAGILPVVAFLTGMLPDQAMIYLRSKIPIFSTSTQMADELPLDMIEGVNAFHKVRLGEVGIDNAQNLAEANLVELLLKTPFTAPQLIDWIAQAKLYVLLKGDIEKLRRLGVRTIFDFNLLAVVPGRLSAVAKEANASELALSVVLEQAAHDMSVERLMSYKMLLGSLGRERSPMLTV